MNRSVGNPRTLLVVGSVRNRGSVFSGYPKIWPLLKLLANLKLVECSLARARNIFATARMLGFSFKFPAAV